MQTISRIDKGGYFEVNVCNNVYSLNYTASILHWQFQSQVLLKNFVHKI